MRHCKSAKPLHLELVHIEKRRPLNKNVDDLPRQIGIYYVIPLPTRWSILTSHFTDKRQYDHSWLWEKIVCPHLVYFWCAKLRKHPLFLEEQLLEHVYGFPRGRVACLNGVYHVYHGADLPRARGMSRRIIERTFRIRGRVKWVEDDHERCLLADKDAVRHLLAVEDDWPAV
jgi:hypothetical protein